MTKGKSRLGRGLGGLLSQEGNKGVPVEASGLSGNTEISKPSLSIPVESNDNSETSSGEKVIEIAVSDIVANPFQPRKSMDSSAVDELAASIKAEGLLQPVVVRKSGTRSNLIMEKKALEGTPMRLNKDFVKSSLSAIYHPQVSP